MEVVDARLYVLGASVFGTLCQAREEMPKIWLRQQSLPASLTALALRNHDARLNRYSDFHIIFPANRL